MKTGTPQGIDGTLIYETYEMTAKVHFSGQGRVHASRKRQASEPQLAHPLVIMRTGILSSEALPMSMQMLCSRRKFTLSGKPPHPTPEKLFLHGGITLKAGAQTILMKGSRGCLLLCCLYQRHPQNHQSLFNRPEDHDSQLPYSGC